MGSETIQIPVIGNKSYSLDKKHKTNPWDLRNNLDTWGIKQIKSLE